ncbi:unnamed protein product [Lasius platythorax]|uniref:Uncharacterized protein n=1 Tax=Lasius platythorax TaxID=488582 RepID=A0AAV2N8F6_9HYME
MEDILLIKREHLCFHDAGLPRYAIAMALWRTLEGKSRLKSLYDLMGLIPIGLLSRNSIREIRYLISYVNRTLERASSYSFAK